MPDPSLRLLLARTLVALAAAAALVVVCYFWIDRPVAFFVDDHGLNKYRVFRWLTYPPPWMQTVSPLVLALLVVRRAFAPFTRCEKAFFVATVSLIVADQFRASLGDLCGRYWPETWFDHNPSLLGTGTYGFHPFRHGDDTGSFPSGHATRILAFATVFWIALPRTRILCLLVCPPMLAALVAMNYHFTGDVIAGSVLGAIVAVWAAQFADLNPPVGQGLP